MALLKQQKVLLSRLQKLIKGWPADPSKKGRDLGEFLKQTYAQKFKEEASANVSAVCACAWTCGRGSLIFFLPQAVKAAAALESLERLDSNYYRGLYAREKELAFSGELAAKNPWILSNGTYAATCICSLIPRPSWEWDYSGYWRRSVGYEKYTLSILNIMQKISTRCRKSQEHFGRDSLVEESTRFLVVF